MKKLIYIIAIAVVLPSCSKTEESAERLDNKASAEGTNIELTPDQIQTIGLTTTHISHRALSGVVRVNGHLDVPPQNLVSISAPSRVKK
jgi:cobalt-zinc-cadmium efflux system membrane fusion protein